MKELALSERIDFVSSRIASRTLVYSIIDYDATPSYPTEMLGCIPVLSFELDLLVVLRFLEPERLTLVFRDFTTLLLRSIYACLLPYRS